MKNKFQLFVLNSLLVLTLATQNVLQAAEPSTSESGGMMLGIAQDLDNASKDALRQLRPYTYDVKAQAFVQTDDVKLGNTLWLFSDSTEESELTLTGTVLQSSFNALIRHELDLIPFGDVSYVIGHRKPDTDTVASAILCSRLLQKLGKNVQPRVSGAINSETQFVLEYFAVPTPDILSDASDLTMILVDHSSFEQAIDGMDKAMIVAMYDHHPLGNVVTMIPPLIKTRLIGSTATILYTAFLEYGVEITKDEAGLIISAILSDTGNLTVSYTTDIDRMAVKQLQPIAGIKDLEAFNAQLVQAAISYEGMTDYEIFISDYKEYPINNFFYAVGSVNAWGEKARTDMGQRMLDVMNDEDTMAALDRDFGEKKRVDLYALIKDYQNNKSQLVYSGPNAENVLRLAYSDDFVDGGCHFDSVVSRGEMVYYLNAAYTQILPENSGQE